MIQEERRGEKGANIQGSADSPSQAGAWEGESALPFSLFLFKVASFLK
jgi:hypothetical protein